MSIEVMAWVLRHSPSAHSDRLLLLVMGNEAKHDGYLSGAEFGSMNYLTTACNFASKQTTIDARDRLIANGELLVRTPKQRGNGRHFEYLIVMGRDRAALAATFGWPAPAPLSDRSSTQTVPRDEAATSPSAARHRAGPKDPATARDIAHRGAEAAPPATSEQVTEPVDNALSAASSDRSSGQTEDGPVSVRYRSDLQRQSPYSPCTQEQPLTVANGPERGHAREAVDNDLIGMLRAALAELAPTVTFDVPSQRRVQLLEHVAAWPDPDDAIAALVAVSALMIDHYGIPKSARAWLPAWMLTEPPAIRPGEPLCDEHPLGDLRVPKRACALCRIALVAGDQTAAAQ